MAKLGNIIFVISHTFRGRKNQQLLKKYAVAQIRTSGCHGSNPKAKTLSLHEGVVLNWWNCFF
jgi:hypothetical protein